MAIKAKENKEFIGTVKVEETTVLTGVTVKVPEVVLIVLHLKEIRQIVEGAREGYNADKNTSPEANAYCKLMHYAFDEATSEQPLEIASKAIHITYWIEWLKVRMAHCEAIRDAELHMTDSEIEEHNGEVFNKDTYITQKLLLCNLMTSMQVQIVDDEI